MRHSLNWDGMGLLGGRTMWLAAAALAAIAMVAVGATGPVAEARGANQPSGVALQPADGSARAASAGRSGWTAARMRAAVARVARLGRARGARGVGWAGEGPAARRVGADLPGTRVIGRLFSKRPDGRDWVCSATLVDSENRSVVWTAGHCVNTGRRGGGPHTDFAFVPGYRPPSRGGPAPFGVWRAVRSATTTAHAREGTPTRFRRDVGGVVLARDALGRTLTDVLGAAQHIAFGRRPPRRVTSYGYPGVGRFAPGEILYRCGPNRTGRVRSVLGHPVLGRGPRPQAISCAQTEGTSGGPWLANVNRNTGVGTVVGVTSTLARVRPWMFSPVQDRVARSLYRKLSTTPN